MVERALIIDARLQAISLEQFDYLGCQLRVTGCGVLHGEQFPWEATEIVPSLGRGAASNEQALAFPVRRDHHNGCWPWQFGCQALECRAAGTGLQGEHGRTVGDKQAGKHKRGPER